MEKEAEIRVAVKPHEKVFSTTTKPITKMTSHEQEEERQFKNKQRGITKHACATIGGTIAAYYAADKLTQRLIRDLPPNKAIWGTRALENIHSVTAVVNALRGLLSRGHVSNFDSLWAVEIGYYIYEMSKVSGLDKLHHIMALYGHYTIVRDMNHSKTPADARRVYIIHAMVVLFLHTAEPFKDFSRLLALYPATKTLSKAVWILHYILYLVRIIGFPAMLIGRPLLQPELQGKIFAGVPHKCLAVGLVFVVLNIIWMYRKLNKFAFP